MKPLVLAASLTANAALLAAFAFQPARLPAALRNFFAFSCASTATPAAAPDSKSVARPSAPDRAALWSTLDTPDLSVLVARLRAAGFPNSAIRAIVEAMLSDRYDVRLRALSSRDDPDAPFWKAGSSVRNDPKRLPEYLQLAAERSRLARQLLGDLPLDSDPDLAATQRRQYGGLSQSKIAQLQRLNQDYDEMNEEIYLTMNGMILPTDREKLALLQRERRADLSALLSPDELADYDLRNSDITARLRPAFSVLHPTEAEFRTIFQIRQAFDDQINSRTPPIGIDEMRARSAQRSTAEAEIEVRLKAALGDQRYAEFARASDRDFQQLTRLAEGENLPTQIAADALNIRDHLSQESNRLFNDDSLSVEQKRAALAALAQDTRVQLLSALGPTIGEAYLKTASGWLTAVERGGAVTPHPGGGYAFRGLPNPDAPRRMPVTLDPASR